ncbi:hypothetical protein AVEN_131494-1, partial [Araneus ventricosus]
MSGIAPYYASHPPRAETCRLESEDAVYIIDVIILDYAFPSNSLGVWKLHWRVE